MDKEKILWALTDNFRGILTPEELLEFLAIGSLIGYLEQHEAYAELVGFNELLIDNLNSKRNLKENLEEVERKVPFLAGVFKELDTIDKVESAILSRFLYDFYEVSKAIEDFGNWFDDALHLLNRSKGKGSGGHTSPETINKIAVLIINPQKGNFYDGVAGFGGGLLEASIQMGNRKNLQLFGQELNPKVWALAKIRLFLHGVEAAHLERGDVLASPAFTEDGALQRFDFVYMDAPLGVSLADDRVVANDPYGRFFYGVPSKRSGDLAFITHALASLNEQGRGIVVAIDGTLYRGGADASIRKNIIASDVVEAVI